MMTNRKKYINNNNNNNSNNDNNIDVFLILLLTSLTSVMECKNTPLRQFSLSIYLFYSLFSAIVSIETRHDLLKEFISLTIVAMEI